MKKTIFFIVLIFVWISIGLVSCSKAEKKTSIRFDHDYSAGQEPFLLELEDTIKEEGKYELSREHQPSLDHKEKVLVDVSGDNLADVVGYWAGEVNLQEFVDADLLYPMDKFFARSDVTVQWDWFPDTTWDFSGLVNGKHYAIPAEQFHSSIFINTAILDELGLEIPQTMQELYDMAPILLENGITPLALGSKRGDGGHLFFSSLVYQFSGGYEGAKNMKKGGSFDIPAHRQAAQTLEIMRKLNVIPTDTISNGGWGAQAALYNSGKALMTQVFPWQGNDITLLDESQVIDMPMQDGADIPSSTFRVGGISQVYFINNKSMEDEKKAEAITDFVNKLINPRLFQHLLDFGGGMPAATNLNLDTSKLTQFNKMVYSAAAGRSILPLHEFSFPSQAAFNNYKEACDLLLSGNITADEFMEKVEEGLK